MTRVYISIGSNIDRKQNIGTALTALDSAFGQLETSTIYESKAMGFDGDPFFNLVAGLDTEKDLSQVIALLDGIEHRQGRKRGDARFGPRTIDLDLLIYGKHIQHDNALDLPREEIQQYAFVLGPLAELAPDDIHPETGKNFSQMWDEFEGDKSVIWTATYQPRARS